MIHICSCVRRAQPLFTNLVLCLFGRHLEVFFKHLKCHIEQAADDDVYICAYSGDILDNVYCICRCGDI